MFVEANKASGSQPASPITPSPTRSKPPSEPPVAALPDPSIPRSWVNHLRRQRSSQRPKDQISPRIQTSADPRDVRHDSALVESCSVENDKRHTQEDGQTQEPTALPTIIVQDGASLSHDSLISMDSATVALPATQESERPAEDFLGLNTTIPTGDLEELSSPDKIKFSQRGSMMIDGKRLATAGKTFTKTEQKMPALRENPPSSRKGLQGRACARLLSTDEAALSQKVRSMYEHGNERGAEWSSNGLVEEVVEEEAETAVLSGSSLHPTLSRANKSTRRSSIVVRQPHELAGGIEDWEDVCGGEVDRYGFIMPTKIQSQSSKAKAKATPFDSPGVHRTSTALLEASSSPRRKLTVRRRLSRGKSQRSVADGIGKLGAAGKSTASINSFRSQTSFLASPSPLRYAANRLPHNRERRWMEEASDMLTLPPGLAQLAEEAEGSEVLTDLKKKEWRREEKWRKMGKTTNRSTKGGGMLFEFDSNDPKLVSRTWKGVPDRWRASAWYSFLAASEAKQKKGLDDDQLKDCFQTMQEENSADDVQIDCDVPRTINRHIMFRRRYRGGQRLLFRVLHAMSIFFPETGYVQGMAALAATLLCYYDEEYAFIMMVRLWQLRGLERLYQAGFGGLMDALNEFEKEWLGQSEIASKLVRTRPVQNHNLFR